MKNIYALYNEAFIIILDLLENLSTIINNIPLSSKHKQRIQKWLISAFNKIEKHHTNVEDFCKFYALEISKDMALKLISAKENIAEALELINSSEIDESNLQKLRKKIHAAAGIWDEKYIEYFEEFIEKIFSIQSKHLACYKNELENYPCSQLIGEKLSTSRTYLRDSPLSLPRFEDSERYFRSEKHPFTKRLGAESHVLYKDIPLKNGEHAHVGSYGNIMQMLGCRFTPSREPMDTSNGDAELYHAILHYKNDICTYVQKKIEKSGGTNFIKVGFYNDYPCIMVFIHKNSIIQSSGTNNTTSDAFKAWIEFLISYFIGLVNYSAYNHNLPIEMERRPSFGFLTPTISSTEGSFRINAGIVPKIYADLLVNNLKILDDVLSVLKNYESYLPKIPDGTFYGSPEHKLYLENKYSSNPLNNIVQLFWAQVEKNGKTTGQNMVRTAYARDGISAVVFNKQLSRATPADAFFEGLKWAVEQIFIRIEGKKRTLSFLQKNKISYNAIFTDGCFVEDQKFWQLMKILIHKISCQNDPLLSYVLKKLNRCCEMKIVDRAYYYRLEELNELIFISAMKVAYEGNYGDGYGSDSDTEGEINQQKLWAKKIIVHNGMRAIWSAIIASANHLGDCRIRLDSTYYEVPLGLKLIAELHKPPIGGLNPPQISVTKKINEANVLLYDLNACITKGVANQSYQDNQNKILILDGTSATAECVHAHLERFVASRASVLFLVESGFKNQQLGADKNPYGTVRIIARDKKLREKLYAGIKKIEPPVLSATSHCYRRQMKAFGATPVTRMFMNPINPEITEPVAIHNLFEKLSLNK